jgi:phosphoglycerate dehydrogenase-like enzyme
MSKPFHIVIEDDVFTRVLDVVLNPQCSAARKAAFADFFAHDIPDFLLWAQSQKRDTKNLQDCSVQFVYSQEELNVQLAHAHAVIVESFEVGRREIELAPHLQVVQKYGFLTKNIDTQACSERGIKILKVRRRANIACAEQAMMMILALAKRLIEVNKLTSTRRLIEGGFHPQAFDRQHTPSSNWARISNIQTLYGKNIGIIGMGEIGQEIAKRALSFEMNVLYTQRTRLDINSEQALCAKFMSLEKLLEESDWVVAQLPATPLTNNLLNSKTLAHLKKGACLINVSRAQCMERQAVLDLLQSGQMGGFALDTLWTEPGTDDDELLNFPNVILTPHLAGSPRMNGIADFEEMIQDLDQGLTPLVSRAE